MTNDKSIHAWFKAFADQNNLGCYVDTSVPDVAALPYLTHEYKDSQMGSTGVPILVNIWGRTASEAKMNEYAEKFRKYIKENNVIISDGGMILAYAGNPFCIAKNDSNDSSIKLRYINITFDFCTD